MIAEITPFAKGETIFQEGKISDALSILRKGEIQLYYSEAPTEKNTEYAHPGDLIGVMALLGRRANLSTAQATKDTEVLKFTLSTLDQIIANNPEFSRKLNTLIDRHMLCAKEGIN